MCSLCRVQPQETIYIVTLYSGGKLIAVKFYCNWCVDLLGGVTACKAAASDHCTDVPLYMYMYVIMFLLCRSLKKNQV